MRIPLMTMFKVNTRQPNVVPGGTLPVICTQWRGTRVIVVLFILHVAFSMFRVVCLEGATPDFQTW